MHVDFGYHLSSLWQPDTPGERGDVAVGDFFFHSRRQTPSINPEREVGMDGWSYGKTIHPIDLSISITSSSSPPHQIISFQ